MKNSLNFSTKVLPLDQEPACKPFSSQSPTNLLSSNISQVPPLYK